MMAEEITLQTSRDEADYNRSVKKSNKEKRDQAIENEIRKRKTKLDYIEIPNAY